MLRSSREGVSGDNETQATNRTSPSMVYCFVDGGAFGVVELVARTGVGPAWTEGRGAGRRGGHAVDATTTAHDGWRALDSVLILTVPPLRVVRASPTLRRQTPMLASGTRWATDSDSSARTRSCRRYPTSHSTSRSACSAYPPRVGLPWVSDGRRCCSFTSVIRVDRRRTWGSDGSTPRRRCRTLHASVDGVAANLGYEWKWQSGLGILLGAGVTNLGDATASDGSSTVNIDGGVHFNLEFGLRYMLI